MTVFERETEVGRCHYQADGGGLSLGAPDYAAVFAHTVASLYGPKGPLKIEQHCLLRCGDDLPEQPWIRPEIIIEPAVQSRTQMRRLAEAAHEQFVARLREQFPQEYWPITEITSSRVY